MNHYYIIRFDDPDRTFNINMCSCHVFTLSEAEAIGKMVIIWPEFKTRQIIKIDLIY